MNKYSFLAHPVLSGRAGLELLRKADKFRNTLPEGLRETFTDLFVEAFLGGRDYEADLNSSYSDPDY
jgi:hypothetical protein